MSMYFTARLVLVLMLMVFGFPVLAQDAEEENTAEVPGLDLFDQDAENTRLGWSQFSASIGFMGLDADGSFSARLPDGNHVTIMDFDRAGLDESDSSYWLSLNWRSANSRWGAWFASWRYDVTGTSVWERDLDLGNGMVIPVGASVTSEFYAQWYIIEATYSFYRSETIDTGIGIGIHAVDLKTGLSARVSVGGENEEIISEDIAALAPLPNGLAYIHWKFAPRWNLIARLGFFALSYDKYSGSMINAHSMISYSLSPRWGLGAGYQLVDLDLDIEETNYVQVYNIKFSGPMLFARFTF
jgi:hypothetical protein